MNEKKLKELYKAEAESSAPDMEALWERIESRLEPKAAAETSHEPLPVSKAPRKKANAAVMKVIAYAAACAALLIVVPLALQSPSLVQTGNSPSGSTADYENSFHNEPQQDNAADNIGEDSYSQPDSEGSAKPDDTNTPVSSKPLNYADLKFTSYSETIITCTGDPYGDSYFVEESVLAQTDRIVRAAVKRVYASPDGSSILYELDIIQSFPESAEETLIAESRSPHTMKRGREYLIPLAAAEEGWRTVFDGIPQTEFTADGGMVYYNGWSSLDSGSSRSIIYPQNTVDDFFYDRMKFSYTDDVSALIGRWNAVKM